MLEQRVSVARGEETSVAMSEAFDPYFKWLAIPPQEQPPNHYRLLGVPLFISDLDVIESAADRQMAHVRTFSSGAPTATVSPSDTRISSTVPA